ncbi:MAG: DUF2802 domain-containing protein [Proteobacteria bacterium]|nr:DUF2802 domain-containing protein [Pseudomonadota bacterium]
MDFTEFSIRYAIICAVAVVAVYMLVSLLRLSQIKRRKPSVPAIERALKFDADGIYTLRRGPVVTEVDDPQPKSRWQAREPEAQDQDASQSSPSAPSSQFGEQLFRSSVEAELEQMRGEVAGLKETIAQLKAARRVSPQYNEAMTLAQRGMDKQSIADECGISIGEAELVLALSRNKQEYEEHDRQND